MYVRLVRFALSPGKHDVAEQLANDLVPAISAQPGCKEVTCFGADSDGECGLYVLWDSRENADAAAQVIRPKLNQHLSGNVQGPPDIRLFEVIQGSK